MKQFFIVLHSNERKLLFYLSLASGFSNLFLNAQECLFSGKTAESERLGSDPGLFTLWL